MKNKKVYDDRTEETLFIDDSPQHVEGALRTGLHALLLDHTKTTLEKLVAEYRGG